MGQVITTSRAFGQGNGEGGIGACLTEWLEGQSQQVWAQVIRALDGKTAQPEAAALHWMVGRRELDRANAVRLFWALFEPEVWTGQREEAALRRSLQLLATRFEAGFYTVQALQVTRGEASFFRRRMRRAAKAAARAGWDPALAAFAVPEAMLRPVPGLPVAAEPALRPVHALTGAKRRRAEALGAKLVAEGRAEMAARMQGVRRMFWLIRTAEAAAVVAVPVAAAVIYAAWRGEVWEILARVGF